MAVSVLSYSMQLGFDAFEYAGYLVSRWRFLALSVLAAVVVATTVSLLLPKRYTATASVIIDAPAGNDPRAATAVSPVYLESLKSYERFAESDTLFRRAIDRFGLRESESVSAADTLKKRVLKVSKPRDTRLLDIQVTLQDPKKAQATAQFIAEETAATSRSLTRETDDEFIAEARRNLEKAQARVEAVEKEIGQESRLAQPEAIQAELEGAVELKNRVRRELMSVEAELAGEAASKQARSLVDPAELQARRGALLQQSNALTDEISRRQSTLGERRSRIDRLEADRKSARISQEAAYARLNEATAAVGVRGERLRVVDPGVVPERPSSPNLMLNVAGALLIALVAAMAYITFTFAQRLRAAQREFTSAYRSGR